MAVSCRPGSATPWDRASDDRARLIRIEDTRADEPAWVDSALASPDAGTRAAAALTVGRIGAVAHLPAVRRLVADSDTAVAASALFALGLMKDSASAPAAALALRRAPTVAIEAAWLLGESGDRGRSALVAALADAVLPVSTRGAAVLALARGRPALVDPLLPLLAHADSGVAWRAAYVLARGRSAAAVRPLLGAARSSWPDVRDHAARGLARSLTGDSLAAAALEALTRLAGDSSARVRTTAVRVLGAYGAAAAAPLRRALRDPDPGVRFTAAPFAHLALDSVAADWDEAWRADTTFAIRRALAESGLKRGRGDAHWSEWRRDPRWLHRASAAELDGFGTAAAALPRVVPPLVDPDGRVRAAAAGVLARLADSASTRTDARTRLLALLLDRDVGVRSTALAALAKGADVDDLARALPSYRLARSDGDLDARLAFWELADSALANARAPLPPDVEQAIAGLARPEEPLERSRAARIRRFAAWRDSTGTARPFGWYQARAREALSARPVLATIETDRGVLQLELSASHAPVTVDNFASLARRGYFDGLLFHRVVPNFVVQGGDPRGDGNGGPGYAIRDELNRLRYARGALGMALSGPHTGGSQFFVTHSPQPHLDAGYTVFGQLRAGGEVLDRIVQGDRIVRITIR